MNAIISLCHFCELHGPSVVFCTQAFRDLPAFDALHDIDACDILESQREKRELPKPEESFTWRYGQIKQNGQTTNKASSGNDACIACRSFLHNRPGCISNDDVARVSYVSSQFPLQSELYVLVRQGCIRSLSCEVCPGKEGPIYFGDEARGHVLSYTFFLRDVQARGFQRWYSILILMKDKMLLLNSWPFLVRHLKETIKQLQEKANKIYETEESKVSHRALRSAASMVDNVRKPRGQSAAGQPRSLPELVGDENVWQHLHLSSTWLLKAGGLRLQERLVEGPQVNALVSEVSSNEGVNVRELSNIISGPVFHRITHHLLIGRQIIIRGTSENAVSIIVQSLKPLLPKHCFRAINFSTQYVGHDTCNILGLHCSAKIPQAVCGNGSICIIDVKGKEGYQENGDAAKPQSQVSHPDSEDPQPDSTISNSSPMSCLSYLKSCSIKISRESSLPARPPQVLGRLESAMGNSTLTQAALILYISTIIYEWINKVKVWMHVQNRKKQMQTSPERVPTHVPQPNVIFRGTSIPVLQIPSPPSLRTISPTGSSGSPPEVVQQDERHQLLATLGCNEWDVPLLEFWSKNFSLN